MYPIKIFTKLHQIFEYIVTQCFLNKVRNRKKMHAFLKVRRNTSCTKNRLSDIDFSRMHQKFKIIIVYSFRIKSQSAKKLRHAVYQKMTAFFFFLSFCYLLC